MPCAMCLRQRAPACAFAGAGAEGTALLEIVHDIQQVAAMRTAIDRLLEVVLAVASGNALKNRSVFHSYIY